MDFELTRYKYVLERRLHLHDTKIGPLLNDWVISRIRKPFSVKARAQKVREVPDQ